MTAKYIGLFFFSFLKAVVKTVYQPPLPSTEYLIALGAYHEEKCGNFLQKVSELIQSTSN